MLDSLRVAAVQSTSRPGAVTENLDHAETLLERAARGGAKLVLFPELMPSGYVLTDALWASAEPPDGPTVRWLSRQGKAHGAWVGTTFVEARGADVFNTFVLADNHGEIRARVRKSAPASVEAFFFKGASDPRVIDTPFGRIGVAICYENMLASVMRELHSGGADLVLMPLCAPTPNAAKGFGPKDVEAFVETIRDVGQAVAGELGVPTIMANPSGPWVTEMPLFPAVSSAFSGLSSITDGSGVVLARLGAEEDLIIADVTLSKARKITAAPSARGRWARPLPWFVNVWAASELLGRASYAMSSKRKKAAALAQREPGTTI